VLLAPFFWPGQSPGGLQRARPPRRRVPASRTSHLQHRAQWLLASAPRQWLLASAPRRSLPLRPRRRRRAPPKPWDPTSCKDLATRLEPAAIRRTQPERIVRARLSRISTHPHRRSRRNEAAPAPLTSLGGLALWIFGRRSDAVTTRSQIWSWPSGNLPCVGSMSGQTPPPPFPDS
jgi:hypothetical protein